MATHTASRPARLPRVRKIAKRTVLVVFGLSVLWVSLAIVAAATNLRLQSTAPVAPVSQAQHAATFSHTAKAGDSVRTSDGVASWNVETSSWTFCPTGWSDLQCGS